MIETSIEIRLFIIRTLYVDATQIAVPFVMGSQLHTVKVPVWYFSFGRYFFSSKGVTCLRYSSHS